MHGPYLKQSQTELYNLYGLPEQPAVDGQSVAAVTNKVPYLLQLEAPVSATVADAARWK